MNILVLSDSHGNISNMEEAVEREKPDMILHLGDCWRDAERLAERYAAAYGNRYSCASPRARKLWETFTEECRREGLLWDMKDIIHDYKKKYACTQLEFQF